MTEPEFSYPWRAFDEWWDQAAHRARIHKWDNREAAQEGFAAGIRVAQASADLAWESAGAEIRRLSDAPGRCESCNRLHSDCGEA